MADATTAAERSDIVRVDTSPVGCRWCTGVAHAGWCSEACERMASMAARRVRAARLQQAVRRALVLARTYRTEGGPADPRIAEVLVQVRWWREDLRQLRALELGTAPTLPAPPCEEAAQ